MKTLMIFTSLVGLLFSSLGLAQLERIMVGAPAQQKFVVEDPSQSRLLIYRVTSGSQISRVALWVHPNEEKLFVKAKKFNATDSTLNAMDVLPRPLRSTANGKEFLSNVFEVLTYGIKGAPEINLADLSNWNETAREVISFVSFKNPYPRTQGSPILRSDVKRNSVNVRAIEFRSKEFKAKISLSSEDVESHLLSASFGETEIRLEEVVSSNSAMMDHYFYQFLNDQNLALQLRVEAQTFQVVETRDAVIRAVRLGNRGDIDLAITKILDTWRLSFSAMGFQSEEELKDALRSLLEGASKVPEIGISAVAQFFDPQNRSSVYAARGYKRVEGTPAGYELYRKKSTLADLVGKKGLRGSARVWTGTIDGKPVKFVTDIDRKGLDKSI